MSDLKERSEVTKVIQNELDRLGLNPKVSDIWSESILFKVEICVGKLTKDTETFKKKKTQ